MAEPEATLPRLFGFLGEDWSPELLQRAFGKKEVNGLGDWKTYATHEIKGDSIGRWKELADDMVARLSGIVNPTLVACGYPPVEAKGKLSNDDAMRLYELAMMFKSARAGGNAAE